MGKNKLFKIYAGGVFLWVGAFFLALRLGVVHDADSELIFQIRFPRTLLASALGVGLSVAGASLQTLFSNPLCEPYTLGISSGSALGAVLGISLGLQWMVVGVAGTAFVGAILFAVILYLISLRPGIGNVTLLLVGMMLGFLGSSLVAIWLTFSNPNGIQGAVGWLFGDLSRARLKGAVFTMGGVLGLTTLIWGQWKELDALLMGEEGACALGVDVANVRRRVIVLTSLLIGLCVSAGGMIGFVGLVIPHFARRLVGSLHITLIPLCAMGGAIALIVADCASRVILQPYEIPVGIVTALVGAPLFLWVMLRRVEVQ